MVVLSDWKQYVLCKDILYQFCLQFKNLPKNDLEFLKTQKDVIFKNPDLNHYFYKFLFTAAYHKKFFHDSDIIQAFSQKFILKDMYGLNQGLSDASTINTAFTLEFMTRHTPFKNMSYTIFSTPLEYDSASYHAAKNHPTIQTYRDLSEKTTGNVNCDCAINGRLYDMKDTMKTKTAQNHIYTWTYDKAQTQFPGFFDGIFLNLEKQPQTDIKDLLIQKLTSIKNNPNISWSEKNRIWTEVVRDCFDRLPENLKIPLVFELPKETFDSLTSKFAQEKIHVPSDVTDNPAIARRAICGVVDILNKPGMKYNALVMTENGLPFHTQQNNSNDID